MQKEWEAQAQFRCDDDGFDPGCRQLRRASASDAVVVVVGRPDPDPGSVCPCGNSCPIYGLPVGD